MYLHPRRIHAVQCSMHWKEDPFPRNVVMYLHSVGHTPRKMIPQEYFDVSGSHHTHVPHVFANLSNVLCVHFGAYFLREMTGRRRGVGGAGPETFLGKGSYGMFPLPCTPLCRTLNLSTSMD